MRDGALPLNVMDFVWEEIKGISLNPQKIVVSYLISYLLLRMSWVENFLKEGKHKPFRPNPIKKPLVPLAQVSSPPRADPTPQQ
jgi:hypothetical protein